MVAEHLVVGPTFFSSARDGSVPPAGGLYHFDVRHLSHLDVDIAGTDLSFVGAEQVAPWHRTVTFVESAPDVNDTTDDDWGADALVLTRSQCIQGGLRERITVRNHSATMRTGTVGVGFGVDFADIFEVRGTDPGIDRDIRTTTDDDAVTYEYAYADADGHRRGRETRVWLAEVPEELTDGWARLPFELESQASRSFDVAVIPETTGGGEPLVEFTDPGGVTTGGSAVGEPSHDPADPAAPPKISPLFSSTGSPLSTGAAPYDRTLARAANELRALAASTQVGPVPTAGVPWFDTIFGRDSLLAAYLTVPVAPALAAGTLRFLAAHQGRTVDEERDEAPGKIFHELRFGELARRGAIPHSPYFGTIDATPLWIVLLHELYRWTGDLTLVTDLWASLEAALGWLEQAIARFGDDPFLYYQVTDQSGVYHKAWRDSAGSLRRSDGTEPSSPIASVEIQGYVYDAYRRAAALMRAVADDSTSPDETAADLSDRASTYEERAARLQRRFDAAFWDPDLRCYAAAIPREATPVATATSNAGHCLWSGVVPDDRTDDLVTTLRSPALFSGWGLRTVSRTHATYHPVSYHRGSVWPHDTALVSLGMAGGGYHEAAADLATGLLDASTRVSRQSLPEVLCGFDASRRPVPHPASCRPQAWAAAAPFGLIRAIFDLQPDGGAPEAAVSPDAVADDAVEPIIDAWSTGEPFPAGGVPGPAGPAADPGGGSCSREGEP